MTTLRINEIFLSLQGEGVTSGLPTTFIRLTGCPLRCDYCDTTYAYDEGDWMECDAILAQTRDNGVSHVMVTGGEPLAQKGVHSLLTELCDAGFKVALETSGALDISAVDSRVSRVVDLKTPGSGEVERNLYSNIGHLGDHDQIKIVITDRADYDWALQQIEEHTLNERCEVLFSPVADRIEPVTLANWIVADRAPVRFQLQLHKQLWGDEKGR